MNIPFVNRNPFPNEVERLRLILSTYQDGTGMLKQGARTLPGWRDFERSVAAAFGGKAQEDKGIYDVLISSEREVVKIGISCKMRGTLREVKKHEYATIEVSNASGEFWDSIKTRGLTQENYHTNPALAGAVIIGVVESWHESVGLEQKGDIDNEKSFYLTLQWDKRTGSYQLFQFPVDLPDHDELIWEVSGRRLIGRVDDHTLLEWYGLSGGQLKYYPFTRSATWQSDVFQLEPLPENLDYGIQLKAAAYFPELWGKSAEGL
ncbi:MAG: hypothetical protein KC421_20985 [Anaerolineales bacterium]|nr:hypothetical protein [Anaerolineales bacterium]